MNVDLVQVKTEPKNCRVSIFYYPNTGESHNAAVVGGVIEIAMHPCLLVLFA